MKCANQKLAFESPKLMMFLCLLLVFPGCSRRDAQSTVTISEPIPTLVATTTPVEMPDYLSKVWPSPGSVISHSEYLQRKNSLLELHYVREGGVGVRVYIDEVYKYFMGDEFGKVEYSADNSVIPEKHMELIVDGEKISHDLLRVFDLLDLITITDKSGKLLYHGSGQMEFAWLVLLEPGEHVASLVISNAERVKILEYEWSFRISD